MKPKYFLVLLSTWNLGMKPKDFCFLMLLSISNIKLALLFGLGAVG